MQIAMEGWSYPVYRNEAQKIWTSAPILFTLHPSYM